MIKRLLGILTLVGLMLLTNVAKASAPGSSGQSQQELVVTINEVCKASLDFDYSGVSYHDSLTATFQERNVYRITRYDNGEDLADLELLSHHNDLSPAGGGTYKDPVSSESWSYQVAPYRSSLLTGVEVSFTRGWLRVSVPINPCSFVTASSKRGLLGSTSHDNDGYVSFTPGSASDFAQQLRSTFKPNSKSIGVHGHASFKDTFSNKFTVSREVDYSITGGDSELPEAVIIPPDKFGSWLPEAGENESTPGNKITATVKLHKRGDPQKSAGKKAKFRFSLNKVSSELGVCLNWPQKAEAKSSPDLKIDPKDNSNLEVAGDGQSATTRRSAESATVTITSYDWGAYGQLTATALLDDGGEIAAHLEGGEKYELTIPQDDDSNHIADWWDKCFAGNSKDATADADRVPAGDGDQGDGLSLYEEYRGFRVKGGQHIRTDPLLKDLFIFDADNLRLGYFAQSSLTTHFIEEEDFNLEGGATNHMVINPNRGFATLGPQHALMIENVNMPGLYGLADGTGPGPPKTTFAVKIDVAECLKTNRQELDCTIAHELAHACNVWHHGDIDYEISQRRYLQEDGTWGKWLPYTHDGTHSVAAQGGQESGVEKCIMRYDANDLYETPTGSIQWQKKGGALQRGAPYPPAELAGTIFCDQVEGTGVNEPGRAGGPKAGNASKGKCRTQFCVNDMKH
jgi:hypothetical protein